MIKILSVFNKINLLRERYDKASIGKEALIKLLNETEISERVYNSNAIENSTLTLEETEKILLQIDLDRFISEREIFEAKNLAKVVSYIDNRAKDQEINLDVIYCFIKMLISNIHDDNTTIIYLDTFGLLVETLCAKLYSLYTSGELEVTLPGKTDELFYRYSNASKP